MQPLKPYFLGRANAARAAPDELPEVLSHRPTSRRSARPLATSPSSRCSATSRSATTSRRRRSTFAWELSLEVLRLRPRTTSGSPSSRATSARARRPTRRRSSCGRRSACRVSGSSRCARSENFWEAGPVGPSGPVLGALPRPRPRSSARPTTSPAARTSASSSSGTSSSCSTTRIRTTSSTPLPRATSTPASASTAWRRSSRASDSVFETDQFQPLIELGQELSGRRSYGQRRGQTDRGRCGSSPTTRAAMTFLVADGVVPSNEDRGYVLRRVMRRAIQHGRALEMAPGLPRALRRGRTRADGRRLPRAARAARGDRARGWPPRRRASGARSSRARGCSTS